jgi:peptide deformylase
MEGEMVREILLLGNPKLYEISTDINKDELEELKDTVNDLHDTLIDFRARYGAGRAIAAPQIGVFKRLLYMYIEKPVVFLNPILHFPDDELMEVLDDCMSFPELLVKVKRYKRCLIEFKDLNFKDNTMKLEGDLAELLQHEYDHLDGILATMRAVDEKALCLKSQIRK